jgi:protein-disulfide isomerase
MPKTVFTVLLFYLTLSAFVISAESKKSTNTFITSQGPQDAPITIIQFSDFQCPSCAKAAPLVKQIFETYSDQVKWIFKNYPLRLHKDAALAHEAALAAGEQGKFWEMHDIIFSNQTRIKRSHLLDYAKRLSLNINQFISSLDSGRYKAMIENDIEEGNTLGVRGAPTFIINGKKFEGLRSFVAFKSAIDKALLIASSIEIGPGKKPIPLEQVAVNIAKSPVRGPTDAPITIIEFSDLQSPLCAKSAKVIDNVMEKYHGKVKWLYKYYPEDITSVHEAACAAEEQGKFWEMHDLIFGRQEAIDALDYILYATQLGMDMDRFMTDLNSRRHRARIQQDRIVGKLLGVRGIPTFFINGKKLEGVRSFTAFEAIIEEELGRLSQTKVALEDARKHSRRITMVGPTDAPVQIMVFSDFQSLQSARTARLLNRLRLLYPDQILVHFKHYPLELHSGVTLAHEAALAAGEQGKFWEIHDLIFSNPRKQHRDQLIKYAKMLELDLERFEDALDGKAYRALVQKDIIHGKKLGVSGVPTLFINGTRVDGTPSMVRLKMLIEAELRQEMLCQE